MRKTGQFLTLAIAITASTAHDTVTLSAPPTIDWIQRLGSSGEERYPDIALDNLGHVLIAGTTTGNLARRENIYGDAFLAQYTTSGNLTWVRQFGNSSTSAHAVAADPHGNAYVVGDTSSTLGIPYYPGTEDAFVAKYDPAGRQQWSRQIGTPAQESGKDIAVDGLGNIYLSGYATGPLNGQLFRGAIDAILMKLHDDGSVEWTREFGGEGSDVAWNVAADRLGNVYVSGYLEDRPSGSLTGDYNAFLSKYDSAGSLKWLHQFGTSQYDQAQSIAIDAFGNIYIGGTRFGSFEGTDPEPGAAFVTKFDSDGVMTWLRQFNFGSSVTALAVDALNNVYASNLDDGTLISKLDPNGNVIWTYPVNATRDTKDFSTWSAAADATQSVYLSGNLPGFATSGAGFSDAFVLRIREVPEPLTTTLALAAFIASLAMPRFGRSKTVATKPKAAAKTSKL